MKLLILATRSIHSLVVANVVVSAVAIALGSLIVALPDRAARIWGARRFANSTPERRDVLVRWYRILGRCPRRTCRRMGRSVALRAFLDVIYEKLPFIRQKAELR